MPAEPSSTAPEPQTVVTVSLGSPTDDYDTEVDFLGHRYRLVRRGVDGDTGRANRVLEVFEPVTAEFAVSGSPPAARQSQVERDKAEVARLAEAIGRRVADGSQLREVLTEWTIRHLQHEETGYFTNARIVLLGSARRRSGLRVLAEYTPNMRAVEAAEWLSLPVGLPELPGTDRVRGAARWVEKRASSRRLGVLSRPTRASSSVSVVRSVSVAMATTPIYLDRKLCSKTVTRGRGPPGPASPRRRPVRRLARSRGRRPGAVARPAARTPGRRRRWR